MQWSDASNEQKVKITKFFEFYVIGIDDAILNKCVDDLWAAHAKDGSIGLDKAQTKALVNMVLDQLSGGADLSDEDFENCYAEFAGTGSAKMQKKEVAGIIKMVAGQ